MGHSIEAHHRNYPYSKESTTTNELMLLSWQERGGRVEKNTTQTMTEQTISSSL